MAIAAKPSGSVRYAVVGLGYIAQVAVLPAFANARRNSRLAALVSGDAQKRRRLSRRYDVPTAVPYEQYDRLLCSGDVDAVYIALPNSMHADYALRAAKAGVHVLCEKPLAVSVRECDDMIAAARRNHVRLMTAYRLHFEKANLTALEIVRSGRLGEPRVFSSVFTRQVKKPNIRLRRRLGGGPLLDLGIYCLNAARTLFGTEPEEVTAFLAKSDDSRFREVEEVVSATLRFPGGRLATFTASFGAARSSAYEILGTKGSLRVEPAYGYTVPLEHRLTIGGRTTRSEYPSRDQFGPELLHFSDCVLGGRDPEPSGREGLADVRVLEALVRSAATGRSVALPPFGRHRHPDPKQEIRRRKVAKPELVGVKAPHRG